MSVSNEYQAQIGDFPFTGECRAAVEAFHSWKNRLLDYAADNPLEALLVLVTGAATVMYLAERDVNEGINTYDDALYYISTCLSVGYANVFPQTQLGKFVAALVMTLGPSMSSWVVEGRLIRRQSEQRALPPPETEIVAKLDEVIAELRLLRGAA
jgi:hypothetical protein